MIAGAPVTQTVKNEGEAVRDLLVPLVGRTVRVRLFDGIGDGPILDREGRLSIRHDKAGRFDFLVGAARLNTHIAKDVEAGLADLEEGVTLVGAASLAEAASGLDAWAAKRVGPRARLYAEFVDEEGATYAVGVAGRILEGRGRVRIAYDDDDVQARSFEEALSHLRARARRNKPIREAPQAASLVLE